MDETTSYIHLSQAVRELGLAGKPICLHSSLKSFGCLEGGADAVIRAFVDAGCTLVVPTFSYESALPPPAGRQLAQNGWDANWQFDPQTVIPFDQNSAMISPEMGAIPARLLCWPGRMRSSHPQDSFGALGPLAAALIADQSPLNVYAPFDALYAQSEARLVLMGVGLTRATAIHFAEQRAGRRLFRRWARNAAGETVEVEVGGCSEGFENLAPFVDEIETRGIVGKSIWRVYPFRAFVDAVATAIGQNPGITHCADSDCVRCNDAVKGGPLL